MYISPRYDGPTSYQSSTLRYDGPTPYQTSNLPQTFYDHVSSIIKLFRKQLTLFVKLSQSFIEETQLVEEIIKKREEGVQAVK